MKEHAWPGKVRMYLSKRSEMADIDFTGLLVPQVFERVPLSLKRTVKAIVEVYTDIYVQPTFFGHRRIAD